MEFVEKIVNALPAEAWMAIVGGPVVSIVLQKLKKWLSLQSEKVIVFLLFVLSFVGSFVTWLVGAAADNPALLGPETAMVVSVALGFYHTVGKPFSNLVDDAKALREGASVAPESPKPVGGAVVDDGQYAPEFGAS